MEFESWLTECQLIISKKLNFDEDDAARMIDGAGISIYLAKFERGLTPQQCVEDELIAWNE